MNPRKLPSILLLLVLISLAIALQGCASTPLPTYPWECATIYTTETDVERCKTGVNRRDERRKERAAQKARAKFCESQNKVLIEDDRGTWSCATRNQLREIIYGPGY